jgi:predicted ribosome quality control (RQC) complex YloA/Tae2 family protein
MDHMHTQLKDPLQLRKELLEGALHSTTSLKALHDLSDLSEGAGQFRKHLREMLQELNTFVVTLEKTIPSLPTEFHGTKKTVKKPLARKKIERGLLKSVTSGLKPSLPVAEGKLRDDLDDLKRKIRALEVM